VKDLYDESKIYIKTVCLVYLLRDYRSADSKCQSYGMFLFNADEPDVEKALLDFSNLQYSPSYGQALYIETKTSKGCAVVDNWEGSFAVYFTNCTDKMYFYCQFVRTPKTNERGKRRQRK
jgi:hypothetical protein